MSGFALSYAANLLILMILYDFCLSPSQFCYIIVYMRKAERRVQITDRCAPWKISAWIIFMWRTLMIIVSLKVHLKLSLCLIKHLTMKAYEGVKM
jgi:hypothetical protein